MKQFAALMLTDLVGSVALQQRLGTAAYMRYVARHDELFQECLATMPEARVLNETGDGFLVRFNDPSDAGVTALRLQHWLSGEIFDGEAMRIRIGVHLGMVTEMDERIRGEKRALGMPINLPARIMDLADGGQILLTRAVYEDARNFLREHPPTAGDCARLGTDGDSTSRTGWRVTVCGRPSLVPVGEVVVRRFGRSGSLARCEDDHGATHRAAQGLRQRRRPA